MHGIALFIVVPLVLIVAGLGFVAAVVLSSKGSQRDNAIRVHLERGDRDDNGQ
jgi:hypothetical protein